MNQHLINLVLALATNELLHNVLEIKSAREKVKRLHTYIDKKPYKEMSLKIDTRAKSYAISATAFVVVVGILFGIFSLLDVSGNGFLVYTIIVLTLAYFATAVLLDKYHVEIEQVTKKFKK